MKAWIGDQGADAAIRRVLAIFDEAFGGRLAACYLIGSRVDGTATA